MASSRNLGGMLHRKAKAEAKAREARERAAESAPSPVVQPQAAKEEPDPAGGRDAALRPEELKTLRKIVFAEPVAPPRPGVRQPTEPTAQALTPVSNPVPVPEVRKDNTVSNVETILKEAMQIDGAVGVALVDYTSGMSLGQAGGSTLNLDIAAAGNTEVVRAKLRTMDALGLREGIEDILITLDTQYHLIRLIADKSGVGLFLYLALNKSQANLAMARRQLANLEAQIDI
jgi:hypothetical protein